MTDKQGSGKIDKQDDYNAVEKNGASGLVSEAVDSHGTAPTGYAFLMAANDGISAEVYENMLTTHGISVIKKQNEPFVQGFVQIDYGKVGVNIFVTKDKLFRARELIEIFDSEPYGYDIPMEEHQRRLKSKKSVAGFVLLMFIFGAPIVAAIFVIIYHLFLKQ